MIEECNKGCEVFKTGYQGNCKLLLLFSPGDLSDLYTMLVTLFWIDACDHSVLYKYFKYTYYIIYKSYFTGHFVDICCHSLQDVQLKMEALL